MFNISKIKEDLLNKYEINVKTDCFIVQNELNYLINIDYENYNSKQINNFKRDFDVYELQKTNSIPLLFKLLNQIQETNIILLSSFSELYPYENVKFFIEEKDILIVLRKFNDYGWIQNDIDINKDVIDVELIKILTSSRILLYNPEDLLQLKIEIKIVEKNLLQSYYSKNDSIMLDNYSIKVLCDESKIIYLINDIIHKKNTDYKLVKVRDLYLLQNEFAKNNKISYEYIYNYFNNEKRQDFVDIFQFINRYFNTKYFNKYFEEIFEEENEILYIINKNYEEQNMNKTKSAYYLYDNGENISEMIDVNNIILSHKFVGITKLRKEEIIKYGLYKLNDKICIILLGTKKIEDFIIELNNNYDSDKINQIVLKKRKNELQLISDYECSTKYLNEYLIIRIDKKNLHLYNHKDDEKHYFYLSIIMREKVGLRYHATAGSGWYTTPLKVYC